MLTVNIDPKLTIKKLDEFLKLPRIVLVNDFTESSAKLFRADFEDAVNTGQAVIPVVIDSYGGQCYSLLSMMDVIKASPVPVATIVAGKAMSCGAILFSCGSEGMRIVEPNATVLIHDVSSFAFGKVEDIKIEAAEVERLNQKVYKAIARNVGQPDNYFLDIIHSKGHTDWYLTPEDCVKHKLANRIGNYKIKVDVRATVSFE